MTRHAKDGGYIHQKAFVFANIRVVEMSPLWFAPVS
jgi:hypothetical protein